MLFKVNKEACIGCGACVSLCDDCFFIDKDGLAKETGNECKKIDDCENVLNSCPAGAIVKIED